jgi:opacity protein-like surface antigen
MRYAWVLLLSAAAVVVPSAAMGQTAPWEVEVHGGSVISPEIPSGSSSLPPPGTTFDIGAGFQSRSVSSWFVGDGAQLLNGVAAAFESLSGIAGARITPLDAVANNPLADRKGGASIGFRVGRRITARLVAEFNFDYASAPFEERASARSGLTSTSASFGPTFSPILSPSFFFVGANPTATSGLEVDDGGREITYTGTVRFEFPTRGRFTPYVAGGAGVTQLKGDGPAATVDGGFSYLLAGIGPYEEHDTVALTQTFDESVFIGVFGGGVNIALNGRSGIRVDARVHMGSTTDRVEMDASPRVVPGSPRFWLASSTNPSISFNSMPQPSPFPPSSLSGPPIVDFTTFEASGVRSQFLWGVGYYFRF